MADNENKSNASVKVKKDYFDFSDPRSFNCGVSRNKHGHLVPALDDRRPLKPDPRANPQDEMHYDAKMFGPTREYIVVHGRHFITNPKMGEAPIPVDEGGKVRLTPEQAKRHPDKFRVIPRASDFEDDPAIAASTAPAAPAVEPVNSGGMPQL